jgi:hypothetical protein
MVGAKAKGQLQHRHFNSKRMAYVAEDEADAIVSAHRW